MKNPHKLNRYHVKIFLLNGVRFKRIVLAKRRSTALNKVTSEIVKLGLPVTVIGIMQKGVRYHPEPTHKEMPSC